MIYPSRQEFKRLAKKYPRVPLYLELLADELTPMALLHSQYAKSPHCFLLESVEGGEHLGRYTFAAFDPQRVVRTRGGMVSFENKGKMNHRSRRDPLGEIRSVLQERRAPHVKGLPRFFGGAVGYFSYDMVRSFENLPKNGPDDLGLPDSSFFLTEDMFVFDHIRHSVKVVRSVNVEGRKNLDELYRQTQRALERKVQGIRLKGFSTQPFDEGAGLIKPPVNQRDRRRYMQGVQRIKRYIGAGDVIQTVLSRRVDLSTKAHPLDVYRTLRRVNPSPYMYFYRDKNTHIIGSSPEMLVRLEDRRAETRPIAGTRPRGATDAEDARLAQDLFRDEKERAEHLMLVDLGRNDLGRVCRYGSVHLPEFMVIEKYSHVMHLVSSVLGKLGPGKDAFDLLRACFPAGTLSGAPKVRAMEIIEELEPQRRGAYGGAVGYFSDTGNMDMAITIRTILMKNSKAYIQAGAGIVADSVPATEFEETQNKAAAMMTAIRLAEKNFRKGRK